VDGASGETDFFYDQAATAYPRDDALGNTTTALYGDDLRISQLIDPLGQTRSFTWCSCGMPPASPMSRQQDDVRSGIHRRPELQSASPALPTQTITRPATATISHGNLLTTVYADGSVESLDNYDQYGDAQLYTNRRNQPLQLHVKLRRSGTSPDLRGQHAHRFHLRHPVATCSQSPMPLASRRTPTITPTPATVFAGSLTPTAAIWITATTRQVAAQAWSIRRLHHTQYDYDAAGRLWHVHDGGGTALATYAYDAPVASAASTKATARTRPTNTTQTGQILHLLNFAPGGTVSTRFDYTYDKLVVARQWRPSMGRGRTPYDKNRPTHSGRVRLHQRRIAIRICNTCTTPVGNRIRTILNGVTTEYTTNSVNEVHERRRTGIPVRCGRQPEFDGVNTYAYDQLNHLISVTGPSGATQYEYDALGNRVATIQNGQRTEYLLDPTGMVAVAAEFDGAGTVQAHNVLASAGQPTIGGVRAPISIRCAWIGRIAHVEHRQLAECLRL